MGHRHGQVLLHQQEWSGPSEEIRSSIVGAGNVTAQFYLWSSKLYKDTIIVAPGRERAMLKWRETAYDSFRNGYNVRDMDHRGQGVLEPRSCSSRRLLALNDFDDYVDELTAVIKAFKANYASDSIWPKALRKTDIFEHSMGDFQAACCFWPLRAPAGTATVADTTITEAAFLRESTASRVCWFKQKGVEWGLYPQNVLAGSAASWTNQAVVGGENARANANKVIDPIFVVFGMNDTLVLPSGPESICEGKTPSTKVSESAFGLHMN
ncbi:hypothetical protein BJ742DRAFT_779927 [Cladochytrium replicatum]|nr:hypothetical protein BJ742DRAFT_779927 [Cladochytrium replicatum]